MSIQSVTFPNGEGHHLAARLDCPVDRAPKAFALFAHCFTCSKNLRSVRSISRALTRHGFGVLRFDFTGLGDSDGDFSHTTFSSNVDDLLAAARFLEAEHRAPALLVGHSLGGAAVLQAAPQIPSAGAVATIGAPSRPAHVQHLLGDRIEEIESRGAARVDIGGRPFTVRKSFLDDLDDRELGRFRMPLLILHSPQDRTVSIDHAAELYELAVHPKSFISLDGADHLLMRRSDADYAGSVIGSWADRYIDAPAEEPLRSDHQVAVRVDTDGLTADIAAGRHAWRADEPADVGGDDFGPTPYELLQSALGSCTAMTLRLYADRKGWDTGEITVHLDHAKKHFADSGDPETAKSRIDAIDVVVDVEKAGELGAEKLDRLMEIARKCPVHRTLTSPIRIAHRLAEQT